MKPVTRYQSDDGAEWKTEAAALHRDAQCAAIAAAWAGMAARPPHDGKFENGAVFIQHLPESVVRVKRVLLDLMGYPRVDAATVHSGSRFGRIADDTGGPIAKAWYRLQCIDSLAREWGQPYYANINDVSPRAIREASS